MLKQTTPYKQITGNQGATSHLKRPVFYGRVSTPEQDEDKGSDKKTSREVQTESPNRWLSFKALPPLRDEDIFFDTATGTNAERPELEKLMREVKQGLVSIVLVWKVDRFARNVRDFHNLLYELEQYGVQFCSTTEGIDTSNEIVKASTKIMMTVYSAFSEMENVTRKDRLFGGRMKKVERDGNWIGGTPPFGYKLVDHMLVAITEEAEIVQFIFKAYREFKSITRAIREAKKEFERKNIKPRIKLDGRQIGRMLKNQLYTGRMYIKRHKKLYDRQTHDVIINIEDFNLVQILLKANYQGHTLAWSVRSPGFIVRDRAVCGHCGHAMVSHHAPQNLKYYACTKRRKGGAKSGCPHSKCHRQERLEGQVFNEISKHVDLIIGQPGYLEEKIGLLAIGEMTSVKKQIESRRREIEKIESSKDRWLCAFEEKTVDGKEMTARLSELDNRRFRMEQQVLVLEVESEEILRQRSDVNKIKELARDFRANWPHATHEQKKDIVNALVRQVRVWNDERIEVDFDF